MLTITLGNLALSTDEYNQIFGNAELELLPMYLVIYEINNYQNTRFKFVVIEIEHYEIFDSNIKYNISHRHQNIT